MTVVDDGEFEMRCFAVQLASWERKVEIAEMEAKRYKRLAAQQAPLQ